MSADRKTGQVQVTPRGSRLAAQALQERLPADQSSVCVPSSPALMKLLFSQVSVELRRRQDDHVRLRLIQTLLLRGAHSSPEEKHVSEITQWLLLPLRPPHASADHKG